MNKIIPMILGAVVLFGCRTRPITPDESWSDYARYYSPTGAKAVPFGAVADVRTVPSEELASAVEDLKGKGYVVIGSFKIADGTDITASAVSALAQKLDAGVVVWSTKQTSLRNFARSNPDLGIDGVDKVQAIRLNTAEPFESNAMGATCVHDITLLGKKQ